MLRISTTLSLVIAIALSSAVLADDAAPTNEQIRAAVVKSLPLLTAGAKGSIEQRKQCFNCHNQGLPVMAMVAARSRGIEIDAEELKTQLQFTADFLTKNKSRYLEGKGQGGQVDTAGYALWTLNVGGWKPDETTAAVAEYFLQYQKDQEHYQPSSRRPPSEQSLFTSSYVALRAMNTYGTDELKTRIEDRTKQVREWLVKDSAEDTEDLAFRVRALQAADAPTDQIKKAREELLKGQQPDGGWAQLKDMQSDAYATGTALVSLLEAGDLKVDDPVYRKGLQFLLKAQKEDGSWHVVSRSKPFQKYFESGYPHGKDQFISSAAAGWATIALAFALPEVVTTAAE